MCGIVEFNAKYAKIRTLNVGVIEHYLYLKRTKNVNKRMISFLRLYIQYFYGISFSHTNIIIDFYLNINFPSIPILNIKF